MNIAQCTAHLEHRTTAEKSKAYAGLGVALEGGVGDSKNRLESVLSEDRRPDS